MTWWRGALLLLLGGEQRDPLEVDESPRRRTMDTVLEPLGRACGPDLDNGSALNAAHHPLPQFVPDPRARVPHKDPRGRLDQPAR